LEKIEKALQAIPESRNRRGLLIDGVYSMHGHVLALKEIQDICRRYNTILYVDDAHGFGVYGENGGGVAEEHGLEYDNLIYVGSLLKGIGGNGGFVAGNREILETLRGISICFVFSDSVPPMSAAASLAALRLSQSDEGKARRKQLRLKSQFVRDQLNQAGFNVPQGESPIISVPIGDEEQTLAAGLFLLKYGVYVNTVVYPAVAKGSGILRISLNAKHSDGQVALLINALRRYAKLPLTAPRDWPRHTVGAQDAS
jgi:7-keto-8-aminopelargonate synthetase-like enzyme